jgi:transcription-repair coupling factor (superfamily II helicase)
MTLLQLPPLLRNESSLARVIGSPTALVAVPEPARAYFVAGLTALSSGGPLLVAVPSASDAERLATDLRVYLGDDIVDVFPAWETLPYERVSPAIETMGRRLRAMWRLRNGEGDAKRVIVAPVKALAQRLGPHVEDIEPVIIRKGDVVDADQLVNSLVSSGYRRDYQVESRGDIAIRGSIVDVFPSTGDVPVRIDLWGDEVDRLSEFTLIDQRSTGDIDCVELFPCRELLPTEEVKTRAAKLVTQQPWGREQW